MTIDHGGPDALGAPRWDFSTNANACGPAPHVLAALRFQADHCALALGEARDQRQQRRVVVDAAAGAVSRPTGGRPRGCSTRSRRGWRLMPCQAGADGRS